MKSSNLYLLALKGFALTGCVVLLFSCISFNIGDKPSEYAWPHNNYGDGEVLIDYASVHESRAVNWCGTVGAFFAYYLMYYIGPGVFLLLISLVGLLGVSLGGVKMTQPVLRWTGLFLLVVAMSSTWYLLWPFAERWPYGSGVFPMGAGGILGIATGDFLKGHLAALGTCIVIVSAWIVGAILLADVLVLTAVRWFGIGVGKVFGLAVPAWSAARAQSRAMSDIWRKLAETQRPKPEKKKNIFCWHRDDDLEDITGPVSDHEEAEDETEHEEAEGEGLAVKVKRKLKRKKSKRGKAKAKPAAKAKPTMPEREAYVPKSYEDYELPGLDLLDEPEFGFAAVQGKMVERKAETLENLLAEFGVNAHVVNAEPGPAITMYELELAPGIKVSQISNLANDMARALGAGSVRVVAPLAGKHTIGIEAPNSQREIVRIKELIQESKSKPNKMHIPLFLGKSSSGEVLVSDLASMPHLLIAGTTGSGKSVCINSIITSIMLTRRPDEVKLILVDPKMVEMTAFESIPHLMCPTITETKRAEQILEWATTKMDERYELLAEAKVRNIASYNKLGPEKIIERFQPGTPEEEAKIPKRLPHIVIIIDELADLMMTAAKEIEAYIVRLAQKSRAVGIHLVVATQRPQATVVTGLIKSNMPARIGFRVAARMDSRIILDQNGAETLLGQGDMLFLKPGTSDLIRSQGAFIDDGELKRVVKHLKEVAQPQFHPELMQLNKVDISAMGKDDMFDAAVQIVFETRRGSVSLLQRRLSIGYARASRIIEMMAAAGILGEYKGSQAREVAMSAAEYEQAKKNLLADEVAGYADLTEQDDEDEEDYEETAESVEEDGEEEVEEGDEYDEEEEEEGEDED
ncbi:MAG: DNA translocase FtsK 4TM domain-containing protein [Planctomycetes bacterium]|nr:DNA translocase FtsK 4TM domain-containing protein [Planctomycetota bacterium]